jgi:uncharacterized SAM-binding protein YcdF (DUF218 family)
VAGGAGTVKELLEVLALPPANLPLLAVAGLIVRRWYPRLGEWLTAVSCVLLIVLAMPFVGETLLVSLERGLPSDAATGGKPGAIVMLTGDIERFGGDEPGFGPGRLTLDRERACSILFRRVQLPVLVTGGVLQGGDPPIAVVTAQSLRDDFQIPVRWIESRSRDTWENAEYSSAILRANGISTVYLVTHAWHMRRALLAFHHFGIHVIPAPVQIDRYPSLYVAELLPQVRGWMVTYYALHEWLGYANYALR